MKKHLILASIFALFFGCLYFMTLDHKLDLNGDNAIYIQLGRNLSSDLGYSQTTINGPVPASHFPPGYPVILSLFMRLGIDNLLFFKILNGLFLLASLYLLIYMTSRITQQSYFAYAVTALACMSPQLLHFAGIAMSEMSYMFFTFFALFSLYRYNLKEEKRFWASPWFYLSVVSAVGAYYIRTIGMAILFAVIIFYLFRKEWWATLSSAALSVALIIPWSLRNAHHGIESRYFGTIMTVNPWRPEEGTISSFGELIEKMLTNFDETVIKGFKELLFPFITINYQEPSGFMGVIVGLIIVAIIFYGAWNLGKLRWSLMAFLLANIGLFALWHGGNGSRYVVPIEPLLYITFYWGLWSLVVRLFKIKTKPDTLFALVLLIMLLPSISAIKEYGKTSKQPYPAAYTNYFNIAKLMEEKAPKDIVVCCRKPELFMYYAPHVRATSYLYTQDTNELLADMIARNVDYVILEQLGYSSTPRYLYPAIQANYDLFNVLWAPKNPDTYLLHFNREEAKKRLANLAVQTEAQNELEME